jgi:streptogramin lyase
MKGGQFMKTARLSLRCLNLILTIALVVSFASTVKGQSGISVSGTVQEISTKGPVQAAEVRAIGANNIVTTVLTNAQGKFLFPDLAPGQYSVTAYRKFYERSPEKKIDIEKSLTGQDFSIKSLDAPPASQLSTADIYPFLPGPSDQKDMFALRCTNCHNLGTPLQASRDSDGWGQALDLMTHIKFGEAFSDPKVRGPMMDYLTTNFGLDSKLIGNFGKQAKETPQKFPLGSDVEFKQFVIPRKQWQFSNKGIPPQPSVATSDGKGNVWYTEASGHGPDRDAYSIDRVNMASGKVTEFELKIKNESPFAISIAKDGIVWFATPSIIGSINPTTSAIDEIPVPKGDDGKPPYVRCMTLGNDGLVWYVALAAGRVDSYDPETKKFTKYSIEDGKGSPFGIAIHGDKVWFALIRANKVGYLMPSTGEIKTYPIPTPNVGVERIKVDTKGRVWIPERDVAKLGLLAPGSDHIVENELPYMCSPYTDEVDRDGSIWVVCQHRATLVRVNPDTMAMSEYPMPSGAGGVARELNMDSQGMLWYGEWFSGKVTGFKRISQDKVAK